MLRIAPSATVTELRPVRGAWSVAGRDHGRVLVVSEFNLERTTRFTVAVSVAALVSIPGSDDKGVGEIDVSSLLLEEEITGRFRDVTGMLGSDFLLAVAAQRERNRS